MTQHLDDTQRKRHSMAYPFTLCLSAHGENPKYVSKNLRQGQRCCALCTSTKQLASHRSLKDTWPKTPNKKQETNSTEEASLRPWSGHYERQVAQKQNARPRPRPRTYNMNIKKVKNFKTSSQSRHHHTSLSTRHVGNINPLPDTHSPVPLNPIKLRHT